MAFAMAGCKPATRPTPPAPAPQADVSYRAVTGDAPRYELDDMQSALLPEQGRANPAPIYPAQLVALRLPPVEIRATLVVDTQGHVSDVRIADDGAADATRGVFDEAVRTAARQWTFTPLRIFQWMEDADGSRHRDDGTVRPFSQDYAFRFELRNGKPVVTAGHASSSAPPPR